MFSRTSENSFFFFPFLLQALCANTRVQSVSKFPELVAVVESRAVAEKGPVPLVKVAVPNLCGTGNFCVFSPCQGSRVVLHMDVLCAAVTQTGSISLLSLLKSHPGYL